MILGLSTYTYGWAVGSPHDAMDEIGLIEASLRFGRRYIQIGDNLPLHQFSMERIRVLKEYAVDNAVRIEVGARKLTEENLRRYISICSYLDAPVLRFVIDDVGYAPDLGTAEQIIRNALPELKQRNITLGIENHDRFKARDLAGLMDNLNSSFVGICLDCVNSLGAGEGLEHVATVLSPYTVNLHIKDFIVKRLPHKMGFTVVGAQAGTGMTNIAYLMELLNPHDRCQSAVLEQWVPPEDNLQATIEKENDWAKQSMQYLKSLPWFSNEE